jgi:carbohydrate-binding DOMON domain-containing protein
MKTRFSLQTLALAALFALGAGAAHAVEFTDAKGDDKGPGNYVYPTDGVYKAGSFDITKFSAVQSNTDVEFQVEVAAGLEDPWGMGGGFATQMVFIFIKTGPGGHTDAPPGLNVQFAPGHEWNKLVVLSPQKKARVTGEAEAKASKWAKDIVVPNLTRGRGRMISGTVPLFTSGATQGSIDGFSYQVVMQSNEGFPAPGDFLTRKVNEYEGQHRFGGGNDGDCDPHVMDVLEDAGAKQAEMLAHTCGPDGKSVKMATLKMIKK